MQKADLNLIKNAFKKEYYELYGVVDAQLAADGAVQNTTFTPQWKLEDAYAEELFEGLKQGLTGSYGKNFYDCTTTETDIAEGANMQRLRDLWEEFADNRGAFTEDAVKSVIESIAANVDDFTSLKGDIPSNYMVHIAFFVLNPTADNAGLAKKKKKAEGAEGNVGLMCYDMPVMFMWVDTYTNNYTTALVHEEDKLIRQSLAFIGKGKAPLFTAVYPNIVDDIMDFDGLFVSCKTSYDRVLTAVGNTFMCDIKTNPTNYARECVESIITTMLGGAYTYDMYTTYVNALGRLYSEDKTAKLSADGLVDVIKAIVNSVGTDVTETDVKQVTEMYTRFFKEKSPYIEELLRDKHTIEFADKNIHIAVEADKNGCFDESVCLERKETEHGIEHWFAVKLSSINEPMAINDVRVLLYEDKLLADSVVEFEEEEETTVARGLINTFKNYLHVSDNAAWDATDTANTVSKNNSDALEVLDEKTALCKLHEDILNANTDELTKDLDADFSEE